MIDESLNINILIYLNLSKPGRVLQRTDFDLAFTSNKGELFLKNYVNYCLCFSGLRRFYQTQVKFLVFIIGILILII